jgi:exopolysaccharide biosynthesis polyprenyl glycosylphosphotransferase
MTNVEMPAVRTFSPSDSEPLRLRKAGKRRAAPGASRWQRFATEPLACDLLASTVAIVVVTAVVDAARSDGQLSLADRLRMEMPATLVMLIGMCCLLGLYQSNTRDLIERFRLRATAMLLFVFVGMLMGARHGSLADVVIVPFIGAVTLVLSSWIEHLVHVRLRRSGGWGVPAAILGTGTSSRTIARLLMSQPAWGLMPVGLISHDVPDSDSAKGTPEGAGGDDRASALPLLGTIDEWRVDGSAEIMIVPDVQALPRDPDELYRWGVRQILVISELGELGSFGVQVRHFDRFVGLQLSARPRNQGWRLKRAIDLAVALPLAALAGPIVALLALAVKILDPGPAFYGQRRVGRDGKPIQVLKLRTMYRDADQRLEQMLATDVGMREQWQRYFKLPRDPRILPHIGHFLRRTSLDELPQLWNVIRGDMSLVGPRPFPAYHLEAFDPEFQAMRSAVPPGLTGLWQISSRSDGDLGVQRAQDCFYIRNRSLWLDLYILIATLPAVIGGQGAK